MNNFIKNFKSQIKKTNIKKLFTVKKIVLLTMIALIVASVLFGKTLMKKSYADPNYEWLWEAIYDDIDTNGYGEEYLGDHADTTDSDGEAIEGDWPIIYYNTAGHNNVKLGNYCWQIIRTTDTGGIKLIYNGEYDADDDGCNITTAYNRILGNSAFNSNISYNSKYVGYKYKTTTDNDTDSDIKEYIDEWYETDLIDYESYLEDTVFCNDRTGDADANNAVAGTTWHGEGTTSFYYHNYSYSDMYSSLYCDDVKDRFSMANENAQLDYPIGLMTEPEYHLGGPEQSLDSNIHNVADGNEEAAYWLISPKTYANLKVVAGTMVNASAGYNSDLNVRPVISLAPEVAYMGGSGTPTDPYLVEEEEPAGSNLYDKLQADVEDNNYGSTYTGTHADTVTSSGGATSGNKNIYYYNTTGHNNVVFGDFCWQIVRTTDTGGVKLIYNGVYNASTKCNNTTGESRQIGTGIVFNEENLGNNNNSPKYVGYKYKTTNWNDTESGMKAYIEDWYEDNLEDYENYLEDTVFCNDRTGSLSSSSATTGTTWYGDGPTTTPVYFHNFGSYTSLSCGDAKDRFTTNNNSAKLNYPVGLITKPEYLLGGSANSSNIHYTGENYWSLSPAYYANQNNVFYNGLSTVNSTGTVLNRYANAKAVGVRPSVSLKPNTTYSGGSGTALDPYIVTEPSSTIYTATFYYQSNTGNNTSATKVSSTIAKCAPTTSGGSCTVTIPQEVRTSTGTYGIEYAGLSSSTGNMTQAVAKATTTITLTGNSIYYAIYRSPVKIYKSTSLSACSISTYYRNQWLSSTSAMATPVLSTSTTGTSNASYSSASISGFSFYGFAENVGTNTRSKNTFANLATSDIVSAYELQSKSGTETVTFYYSGAADGTVANPATITNGPTTTYLRIKTATASACSAVEQDLTHDAITTSLMPSLTGETAPTGTSAVGWAKVNGSMVGGNSNISGSNVYYRIYRQALKIYYPDTSNGVSYISTRLYRNAYIDTASPVAGTTKYTTITATGSSTTDQATAPGTISNLKGTFAGITPTVNSTTYYSVSDSTHVVHAADTTYYAVTTDTGGSATIHYNSNTTSGQFTDATASAEIINAYYCASTSTAGVDYGTSFSLPSTVTNSVGKYNSSYKGISSSNLTITNATTLTDGSTYYAYYSSPVTIYYPTSTTAAGHHDYYRNEYYSTDSMISVVNSTQTSTSNYTFSSSVSGYDTLVGFNTSAGQNSATSGLETIRGLAQSSVTTVYEIDKKTETVTATFYYNDNATCGSSTIATTTASGTKTTLLRPTSPGTAGTKVSHGTITVPSAVTSSKGPYNGTYVGVTDHAIDDPNTENTVQLVTDVGTYATTYYAFYSNTVTDYYASSASTATSYTWYRNEYFTSNSAMNTVLSAINVNDTYGTVPTGSVPTVSGYSTLVGFNTSAGQNSPTSGLNDRVGLTNSCETTVYQINKKEETVTTTWYYSTDTDGTVGSATKNGTRTTFIRPTSTSAAGTNVSNGSITPPTINDEVAPTGTAPLSGWATAYNNTNRYSTYTVSNTKYYKLYQNALTIYYPNTSDGVSSTNDKLYRNAWINTATPTVGTTKYTTVVANNWYGANFRVQLTNSDIDSSVLSNLKGSFAGLAPSVNSRTRYAVDNSANVVQNAATTYYAVTTESVTATFYYSNSASGAKTSTTASGNREYYCASTSAMGTYDNTLSPSISETAPYGTTANGWHTAVNSMSTTSPTTANTTYYRNYSKAVMLYYYNGSSYTNTTQYRNSYIKNASDTSYTTVLASSNTGLSNYSTAAGPGSSAWYGLSTGQDTTREYSTVAGAAGSNNYTFYTVYQFNVTYTAGSNVSSIGSNSGSCLVTTNNTSCNVTLPSITPNSGYSAIGWKASGDSSYTTAESSYSVSTNNTELTAYAGGNSFTATFYYQSNATSGSTTVASTTATCTVSGNDGTCNVDIPTAVLNSGGTYNNAYAGLATSTGTMSAAVNSSATSITLSSNSTYYAVYRTTINIYYPTSTSVATSKATYQNQWFTSNSAMATTVLSTTNTGTTTDATAGALVSEYSTLVGFNTAASQNVANSGATIATLTQTNSNKSGTRAVYQIAKKEDSVTATFYYNNNATCGSSTIATTTASGTRTTYLRPTSTSAAGRSASQGSITIPSTVTSSKGKYNGNYVGVIAEPIDISDPSSIPSTTSVSTTADTSSSTYYAFYSNAVTDYYASSASTAAASTFYRNEYFTSNSAMYAVLTAIDGNGTGNYGITHAGSLPTVSGYSTLVGFNTSAGQSSATSGLEDRAGLTNSCTTTVYQINKKTESVTATFYYNNNATCGSSTIATTTASGTKTTYIRPTSTSAAGTNVSQGSITIPSAVTSSKGKYNGDYVGVISEPIDISVPDAVPSTTEVSTTADTSSSTYYAFYSNAVTDYYASSASAATSTTFYRNEYFTSNSAMYAVLTAIDGNGTGNYGITHAGDIPTVSGYSTLVGFNTSAGQNSSTSGLEDRAGLTNSCETTVYQINKKTENVTATFYYSTAADGTVGSKTSSGTKTTFLRPTSTSAAGTSVSNGTISVPTINDEVVPTGTARLTGWATAHNSMSPGTTYNTGTTKYYAVYRNALTIYYPNTSNTVSSANDKLYRNAYLNTNSPTVGTTKYTTVTSTSSTGTTQSTGSLTLSNLKGTFAGITPTINSTTYYDIDNSSNVVKNSNTTYYTVTTGSENAVIHYNSNTTNGSFTDATANASVTTKYYCETTSAMKTEHGTTSTVPSVVTNSVGKYNSAYKGISSSSTGITPASTLTGGNTYYAYYQTPLTAYYYSSSSYTSKAAYRNEYYSSASAMSSAISTSATGTSNWSTSTGPGNSVNSGYSTAADTTVEYADSAAVITAPASDLTTTSKLYTVYTFNTSYEKGLNVSNIGSTTGSCKVTYDDTSCDVTLPSITPNTGYTSVGWNTTSGATTGTAAGLSYTVNTNNTKLYANATDNSAPVCSITSTNNVAASQTATLSCTDSVGVTKYYWGTNPTPSDSDFTTVTSTTSLSTTKTVSNSGTYYLIAKDTDGNTSTVVSKEFYKTTLNMTNGTVSPTSVMTESGKSFNLPTPTANTYYTAKGNWYTNSGLTEGAKAYGASYTPSGNATLYSGATHNTFTPTVAMAITNEKTIYKSGDTITYTITVTNNASYAITNVVVSDPNATIQTQSGVTISGSNATIASIPAGSSVTLTATKTLGTSNVSSYTNTATITSASSANAELSGTPSASKTVNIQSLIKISKTVEGNMADASEYFRVKVTISGTSGHKYTISGQSYTGSGKQTTYTVGQNNYIYVKHGETVTIGSGATDNKIATGTAYSIEEDTNDYETYINNSSTNSKTSGNLTTSTTTNTNTVTVRNVMNQTVVTGLSAKYTSYIIIFAITIIGIIIIITIKKLQKSL